MPEKIFDIGTASLEEISQAMARGVHAAVREHKLAGRSIVVWRGGKIVHIPADEIVLFDEEASPSAQDNSAK